MDLIEVTEATGRTVAINPTHIAMIRPAVDGKVTPEHTTIIALAGVAPPHNVLAVRESQAEVTMKIRHAN